jgi:hypothetical protein
MEENAMRGRQPTPGVHEHFAPILDKRGQGSGLWFDPAKDGRDRARNYTENMPVAYIHEQLMVRVGKKYSGRLLDSAWHHDFPEVPV